MNGRFTELTRFIPILNSECLFELIDAVYEFDEKNPEMGLHDYKEILEANGIAWDADSMEGADVSKLDAKAIFALLMGAIRADRFCDGALTSFLENGAILRWLERLKEIDG